VKGNASEKNRLSGDRKGRGKGRAGRKRKKKSLKGLCPKLELPESGTYCFKGLGMEMRRLILKFFFVSLQFLFF
jgi:hypothetical protein